MKTDNGSNGEQRSGAPVQYIPRADVDFSRLERTDHTTYCPYKGDCNYYSVPSGGKKSVNAVWTYEKPYPAVAQIEGHFAFYPDRVDEIVEQLSNEACVVNEQSHLTNGENYYERDDTREKQGAGARRVRHLV